MFLRYVVIVWFVENSPDENSPDMKGLCHLNMMMPYFISERFNLCVNFYDNM